MSLLNKIPQYTIDENKKLKVMAPDVYLDDVYDPFFNKNARSYLKDKYGYGPVGTTLAGMSEVVDNALFGQKDKWGILGPGMGILSSFGRSVDKTGDFLIGGITEGVNAVGQVFGSKVPVENPIENIFVNDQDYSGRRLLAAMANSMSGFAGGTTIDENDLSRHWNITGTGLDLATDPGILGSSLARKNPVVRQMSTQQLLGQLANAPLRSNVSAIGELLYRYDDLMGKVAIDLTVPGLRQSLKRTLGMLNELVEHDTANAYTDVPVGEPETPTPEPKGPDFYSVPEPDAASSNIERYEQMAEDLAVKYNINPVDTPEEWVILNNIREKSAASKLSTYVDTAKTLKEVPNLEVDPTQYLTEFNEAIQTRQAEQLREIQELDNMGLLKPSNVTSIVQELPDLVQLAMQSPSELDSFFEKLKEIDSDNYDYYDSLQNIAHEYYIQDLWDPDIDLEYADNELIYFLKNVKDNLYDTEAARMYEYALNVTLYKDFAKAQGLSGRTLLKDYPNLYDNFIKSFSEEDISKLEKLEPRLFEDLQALNKEEVDDFRRHNALDRIIINTSGYKPELFNFLQEKLQKVIPSDKQPAKIQVYYSPHSQQKMLKSGVKYAQAKLQKVLEKHIRFKELTYKNPAELIRKLFKEDPDLQTYLHKSADKVYIPGLYELLKPPISKEYRTVTDRITKEKRRVLTYAKPTIYKYYENLTKFVQFMDRVSETSLINKRIYYDLYEVSEDIKKNILANIIPSDADVFDANVYNADVYSADVYDTGVHGTGIYDTITIEDNAHNLSRLKGIGSYVTVSDLASPVRQYLSFIKDNISLKQALQIQGILSEFDVKVNGKSVAEVFKDPYLGPLAEALKKTGTFDITTKVPEDFKSPYYRTYYPKYNETHITPEETLNSVLLSRAPNMYIDKALQEIPEADFLQQMVKVKPDSMDRAVFDEKVAFAFPEEYAAYKANPADWDSFDHFMQSTADPYQKRLYDLIQTAKAIPEDSFVADLSGRQTLKLKTTKELLTRSENLNKGFKRKDRFKYLAYRDAYAGDIIKGENFLSDLIATSDGFALTVLPPKHQDLARLRQVLTENVKIANSEKPILKLIDRQTEDGLTVLGYCFDTSNLNVINDVLALQKKKVKFKDTVFQTPNHTVLPKMMTEYADLNKFFDDLQTVSEDLSTKIGFTDVNTTYFKHVLNNSPDAAEWLTGSIYKDLPMEDLADIATQLSYLNDSYGVFGNLPSTRSLRGSIYRYNSHVPVFSTDLTDIVKSTLGGGIFNDQRVQTFVGLFESDNLKVRQYFKSPEDLKKVFYSPQGDAYLGNLENLTLATYVRDDMGRIQKFKKFDKYSDKGLQAAFKDPNTILVPDLVLGPLDTILKKRIKMSNPIYRAFNRYLTIPFKFGVICNPGFIVGNISDAAFKQIYTMAQKYGTSVTEEISNFCHAARMTMVLNNQFMDVYDKYVQFMKKTGKELPAHYIPIEALNNIPQAKKKFIDFMNSPEAVGVLTSREMDKARLWFLINNVQETTGQSLFKRNYEDLADLVSPKSTKYTPKKKFLDRILFGSDNYDKKNIFTWGFAQNNIFSDFNLWASNNIETLARSSSILNDLIHKYGSLEDVMDILGVDKAVEKEVRRKLDVDVVEAMNTVHNINYDYNNMSEFMSEASKFIPFPVFFMKNFAYWMNLFANHPAKIGKLIKVQQGMWGDRNIDATQDQFLAEAKGRGAIPFGQKMSKFFKGVYKPSPLNSMFGAFDLLNQPTENLAFRLHPALSLATSKLQPKENVKYRPYSTNPYERNVTADNPNFNELEYMFHRLNPYEKISSTLPRLPKKVASGNAQLADFLPSIFQPDYSKKSKRK